MLFQFDLVRVVLFQFGPVLEFVSFLLKFMIMVRINGTLFALQHNLEIEVFQNILAYLGYSNKITI